MSSLSIVIPAFNEVRRLPRTLDLIEEGIRAGDFGNFQISQILIVNDGSTDQTSAAALRYLSKLPMIQVIEVSPNRGKGHAVRSGLQKSTGEWALIADADSATPWNQIKILNDRIIQTKAQIAIGSRDLPESNVQTHQSWIREHMGKTFNLLVRMITGLPFKDTQCGFKLIQRSSIEKVLPLLTVDRFSWDVEFLFYAKRFGLKIIEVPVTWAHQDASSVHAIRDSLEMLFRIIQLRIKACGKK